MTYRPTGVRHSQSRRRTVLIATSNHPLIEEDDSASHRRFAFSGAMSFLFRWGNVISHLKYPFLSLVPLSRASGLVTPTGSSSLVVVIREAVGSAGDSWDFVLFIELGQSFGNLILNSRYTDVHLSLRIIEHRRSVLGFHCRRISSSYPKRSFDIPNMSRLLWSKAFSANKRRIQKLLETPERTFETLKDQHVQTETKRRRGPNPQ